MNRLRTWLPWLPVLFAAGAQAHAAESQGIEFFETHIRPLLVDNCYECHSTGAEKLKANLYLDSRAGWETGGDSGPALIPGKPEESLLLEAVSHTNNDLQMPPKKRLSDHEIEKLKEWILMGAPDPRDGEVKKHSEKINITEGRKFWSFTPPATQPIPKVKEASWPRNDIDHFILSRLEDENLEPVDDAAPATLLRRIHYDLTGLPPTPEEIKSFLADPSPPAFEKVVDDLLSRPEFGERWGRHWLDVARFAESSGGGRSMIFPHAWRFRDYIIDSFNRDKPYNQLVKEHLAGDLLPAQSSSQRNEQLIGSGYLVLGALNYELQDQELLRMEFVDEQIDTMGRTFLGMTLGCARCHDHKFDPIPTADYYALAGIFQSTESMGVGSAASGVSSVATVNLESGNPQELEELSKQLTATKKSIALLKKKPGSDESSKSIDPDSLPGITVDSSSATPTGTWKNSTRQGRWVGRDYLHDDNRDKGASHIEFSASLPETRKYEVFVAYNSGSGRSSKTPITVHHAEGATTILLDQRKPPSHQNCLTSVGTFSFSTDRPARVVISNEGTDEHVIADAVNFSSPGALQKKIQPSEKKEPASSPVDLKTLEKNRKDLEARIKDLQPKAMAPRESEKPADGHIHIRGLIRNKGEKVPRGFLTVASKPDAQVSIPEKSSGRLELANWVARPDNPLTSRVMVNRIWKHLLGEGLVRTTDNFGKTGELPSHPELLDHLALQFSSNDWSIKSMVREIVLSRTYQMASGPSLEQDPENKLLARANRKRLEAEAIRDTALMVSGQLENPRGGSTMGKVGQYDLNYKFDNKLRSVYSPWFRNSMIDLFEVFDAPNPNLVVGKRTTSNIPTQALFLMNSPFIREQSSLTARKLLEQEALLEDLYLLILGRLPSPTELTTTGNFLSQFPESEMEEAWTQVCQTLFSCVDFRFLD